MFWIVLTLVLLHILGLYAVLGVLLDVYVKYFGVKVVGKVNELYIIDNSNPDIKNGELFNLTINYSYEFNDTEYTSNRINSFSNMTRKSKYDIEQELNISNDEITVYVLNSFPKISMTHPLKFNKLIITFYLFIGCVIPTFISYLVLNKLTVFDVFLG